jgi:hypothetical protein
MTRREWSGRNRRLLLSGQLPEQLPPVHVPQDEGSPDDTFRFQGSLENSRPIARELV